MKDLVTEIAKALVDIPDEVVVREVQGEQVTVLELRVAPSDLGKVIGKQGRTARSIRTLLSTCSAAGVHSMSPAALWNFTARWPGALDIPPIW